MIGFGNMLNHEGADLRRSSSPHVRISREASEMKSAMELKK